MHRKLVVTAAAGIGVALCALTPAFADAASTLGLSTAVPAESTLSSAFLASGSPKTVVLDPTTGAVVSVTAGEPAFTSGIGPEISSGTSCASDDGCYYAATTNSTYHDRSFYGSAGTFTGSWPLRDAWESGNYTASVCWDDACSGAVGPNTYSTFGGATVTGTSFTIR